MADDRKECCKVASNLSAPEPYQGRADMKFRRCSVCQCRHFHAQAQGLGQPLKK